MQMITITRFAEEVGYSRRQIHRFISSGTLVPQRTQGGKPFFRPEDVEKFKSQVENG